MFWRMDAAKGGEERSSVSGLDPSAGGRAARCGGAGKDLDNDHAAAAARARRAMVGRGVRIGGVVHYRRLNLAIGAAINCLVRAMLALQLALTSSP